MSKRYPSPHYSYPNDPLPAHRSQLPRQLPYGPPNFHYWLMATAILVALALVLDPGWVFSSAVVRKQNQSCQEIIQRSATLSRAELAALLTIPERESLDRIREVVPEPYCILPSLQIRAGTIAVREAYPLEFDPDTWLIVLYEGEEYAGYDFIHN